MNEENIKKIARILRYTHYGKDCEDKNWPDMEKIWINDVELLIANLKKNGLEIKEMI